MILADLFTKQLQGQLFSYLRDTIMGYIPMYEILEYLFSNEGACWKT